MSRFDPTATEQGRFIKNPPAPWRTIQRAAVPRRFRKVKESFPLQQPGRSVRPSSREYTVKRTGKELGFYIYFNSGPFQNPGWKSETYLLPSIKNKQNPSYLRSVKESCQAGTEPYLTGTGGETEAGKDEGTWPKQISGNGTQESGLQKVPHKFTMRPSTRPAFWLLSCTAPGAAGPWAAEVSLGY